MRKRGKDVELKQILPKQYFCDSKTQISPFVFAEKPSSVQIMDKAEVLQKDKLITVRFTTALTF